MVLITEENVQEGIRAGFCLIDLIGGITAGYIIGNSYERFYGPDRKRLETKYNGSELQRKIRNYNLKENLEMIKLTIYLSTAIGGITLLARGDLEETLAYATATTLGTLIGFKAGKRRIIHHSPSP